MESVLKVCNKCDTAKPIDRFSKNPKMKSGLQNFCKDCGNLALSKYRKSEKGMAAKKLYRNSEKGKRLHREYQLAYDSSHPGKRLAHFAVKRAIKSGALINPLGCWFCGSQGRIEAHHADYQNRLGVTWLCKPCHAKAHSETQSYLDGDQETQAA